MKIRILLLTFLIWNCGTLTIKPPIYKPVSEVNYNENWIIKITNVGFTKDVENHWWGDKYYQVVITVKNNSDKYRFLNLDNYKLTKFNFDYIMERNPDIYAIYSKNPDSFDLNEFLNQKNMISLKLRISKGIAIPNDTYGGKPIFPIGKFKNENVVSAALIKGDYGAPGSGPVQDSDNSSGWMAPGETRILMVNFSVIDGLPLHAVVIPEIFESILELNQTEVK
ncbi:hypothetical protein NUH30_09770 [Leptospira sp. 85282-16]|uniref:hypothetical protein n=1 Tax=Leptospira sp. 85282-16 TaxID=2971256 RepID=UPI0021C1AC83|nr:hypothetical protein [Leptospira sp. 85282-16]MCT8333960.1 hypothetical protein [Leptospira sp. 85282-16]